MQDIKVFVMDCDGVLTDGTMYYGLDGELLKGFNTRDGKGLELLQSHNIRTALISGENSPIISQRAKKLKIDKVWLGVKDKKKLLNELKDTFNVSTEEIAFIGDDINDIELMKAVGVSIAVADANITVKSVAKHITKSMGGRGAVREAIEFILEHKGERTINVGSKLIGESCPCLLISEIGNNHQGDLKVAKKLIDMSYEAGVDAVKLQKRDNFTLLTEKGFSKPYKGKNSFGNTYGQHREHLELSKEDFLYLQKYAEAKNMIFFSSVWDENSVDVMEEIDIPLYKIPSSDLTNLKLIEKVADTGKPTMLSTGMSYLHEIDKAVEIFIRKNEKLVLMHCVSIYPHPPQLANLKMIETLRQRYHLPVGYSSHDEGILLSSAAVLLGAVAIEKHITLDRGMKGGDHSASVEMEELKRMVEQIRIYEKARGNGIKELSSEEIEMRKKLGKSLVAGRDIKKGERLSWDNIAYKCANNGMYALDLGLVFGKTSNCDIKRDEIITECAILS